MRSLYQRMKRRFPDALNAVLRVLDSIEKRSPVRAVAFFAVFVLIAAIMYVLNTHTPLIMDDFDYMYSWATGEKIAGIGDVLGSQAAHYMIWGGRSVVHALLQATLFLGEGFAAAANTLAYVCLLLEISYLARTERKGKGLDYLLPAAAHLILFTMIPFFGMVFLWTTGSCNYLWGTVLALTPLLVMRSVREGGVFSRGSLTGVLCAPIGLIAGWTNENTACGIIAVVFVQLLVDLLEERRLRKRLWVMWAAQCIGAVIMLAAPGNGMRAETMGAGSLLVELIRRLANVTVYGASYLGVLFAAAVLMAFGLKGKGARIGHAGLLLFGALIASYAMIGSPVLSDRTFTSSFVLVIAAVLMLLGDLLDRMPSAGAAKLIVMPALIMVMVYTGYHAVKDVRAYESQWLAVTDTIEQAVRDGKEEVVVPSVHSHSRFTVDALLEKEPALWPNSTMEKHYGIRIIGG